MFPVTLIDVIALVQGVQNDCASLQSRKPSSFSGIVDDIIAEEESGADWEWGESG